MSNPRYAFAVALAAALVVLAGAAAPTNPPPESSGEQPQGTPVPKPIPVPDGPVVHSAELEGGLLVEDLVIGTGYEVKAGGAVVALYHGTLKANGKKFDSAFERGAPIAFPLDGVIKGWQMGVPGMKVGGVRRLTIPAALAYGDRAMGPDLPANSDLVFVIQLTDALQVEDISPGEGELAAKRHIAATAHSITVDGEVVESATAAQPYIWLRGEMMPDGSQWDAMQAVIAGMRVGGKRKAYIPSEMNYCPPQVKVQRPLNTDLTIELELITVRNLPG